MPKLLVASECLQPETPTERGRQWHISRVSHLFEVSEACAGSRCSRSMSMSSSLHQIVNAKIFLVKMLDHSKHLFNRVCKRL